MSYLIMPIIYKPKNIDKSFLTLQRLHSNNRDVQKYIPISLNLAKYELKQINERKSLPANREWVSSEYSYNKTKQKLSLPTKKTTDKLIKSYFNLTALREGKKSRHVEIRFRRLSINRIFVSKSDIKHSNNKAVVTIYTYNREKKILLSKVRKLYTKRNSKNTKRMPIQTSHISKNTPIRTNHKLKNFLLKGKKRKLKNTYLKKTRLAILNSIVIMKKVKRIRKLLLKSLDWKEENFKFYETYYYKNFLKKLYKKQIVNLIYEKTLHFNKSKYSNWFLIGIKSLLSNIYKKKVELNIIDLKYLHYNSDNFIEAVSTKLRNRNNRLKKVLRKAIKLAKIPRIGNFNLSLISDYKNKDFFSSWLKKKYNSEVKDPYFVSSITAGTDTIKRLDNRKLANKNILNSVLKITKYKIVNGVRLEAAGRLSKRLTASKSISKYRHKGSLKDIDSSYKGFSSNISRGYNKPNLQQTSLNSKTRNGAFGLRGYLSSYTGAKQTTFSSSFLHSFLGRKKY